MREPEVKLTQKEIVRNRILETGSVDNFWAIQNFILRLGSIIFDLRKEGMIISGKFGKDLGLDKHLWKNYYYLLHTVEVRAPEPIYPSPVSEQAQLI